MITMLSEVGEIVSVQEDGSPPLMLASGHAPGDSGLSVASLHYQAGAHFSGMLRQHLISFVSQTRIRCRLAGEELRHDAHEGSLAICPAGLDASADTDQDVSVVLIAVHPHKLALAAAENGKLEAQLISRLSGHDQTLLNIARILVLESQNEYSRGTIFWNETAGRFIDTLAASHTAGVKPHVGGTLGKSMLDRLRDFILEHLNEPLDVATLAGMAGLSQYHFSRAFARSVGISPYQYVIHLRLKRAVDLVRDGSLGFAEIAAKTGFSDQSHLTRWVRRVHGVSPTQLPGRGPHDQQECSRWPEAGLLNSDGR
jgi:AraC family transcriptional regulator